MDELALLRDKFGSALVGDEVEIARYYEKSQVFWSLPINEGQAIVDQLDKAGLSQSEKTKFSAHKKVSSLLEAMKLLPEPSAKHQEVIDWAASLPAQSPAAQARQILEKNIPKFFYASHYDRMSGEVSVNQLAAHIANNEVKTSDKIFLDFLSLAGTSLDELKSTEQYEELKAKCEAASNDVTEQIFEYWRQNDALEVHIDIAEGKTGDPAPLNSGTIVHARVWNKLHRASVPFSERSAGFVWFFSFLVQFAAMRHEVGNVIILLDEPGLTLHGKAQADLLRYFRDELLPHHQVIFSTHSPFMVPANDFASVRVVEDVIDKSGPRPIISGTKVRADALAVDPDTLFPLQGALGYDITQSLFIGENTLLVEGPSDLLYLKALSVALTARKRKGLDPLWIVCPTGGLDKVKSFAALFGGQKLNIAALTDLAKGDRNKIEDLRRSEILSSDNVFTYADFVGRDEADVEDVFEPDLFALLVNAAYSLTGKNSLTATKLSSAQSGVIRQVKQAEALFRIMPASIPNFDHFTPAAWLIENISLLSDNTQEIEKTLDTAETLFRIVNARIKN